jgi:hypothetical protein
MLLLLFVSHCLGFAGLQGMLRLQSLAPAEHLHLHGDHLLLPLLLLLLLLLPVVCPVSAPTQPRGLQSLPA